MSDPILPKYSFLPWLRQGISNQIDQVDNLASGGTSIPERVSIDVQVNIIGNGSPTPLQPATNSIKLIGPGDVIGISPSAIVKTEPLNWITNFEPNYFPYIDFYDEDFPWRYTPASPTANHQLRPWFALVVLKDDEFKKVTSMDGLLPSIELDDAFTLDTLPFPKFDETWAWSHVHVNADLYTDTGLDPSNQAHVNQGVDRLTGLLSDNPDIAISRMICPRELEQNTDYHAFLIPAFETGRMAGLGIDQSELSGIDAQLPSWGLTAGIHDPTHLPKKWPVYHEWFFKTGAAGDFEYLVRQIVPRTLDERVGKREMDIRDPGYGLNHDGGALNGALELEGALRIPGNAGVPYPWLPGPGIATDFRVDLANLVNLGENALEVTFASNPAYVALNIGDSNVSDDPIVAPPMYGRWHALKKKTDPSDPANGWVHELNLDPRNRVIANVGTEVIQKDQDQYMDIAWGQVGEVIEANKKLKWAQVSKETSSALFNRHIKSQPKEEKLQLTSKVQKKVISSSGGTIHKNNKESILPLAAESRAYRKIRRTNGPVMKRVDAGKVIANSTDTAHITARMSEDIAPVQAAEKKVIANQATNTPVFEVQNVLNFSSNLDVAGYNFNLAVPGAPFVPAGSNAVAQSFKSAVEVYEEQFDPANWVPETPLPAFDLQQASDDIDEKIDPQKTLSKRVYHAQKLDFSKPYTLPPADKIVPILAAPSFNKPMYETIRDKSLDLLIPNLNLITQNTISLLETNQKFIESFMVGINHEMGRELLWREYPTDQRGTYFKHFWDATDFVDTTEALTAKEFEDKVSDIGFIHEWPSNTELGTHNNRSTDGGTTPEAQLVLVIRGDLLKKYPSSVIYAQRAEWQLNDSDEHDYSKPRILASDTEEYPIFGAKIDPDINFIGFNLTACQVKGDEIVDEMAPHGSYDPGYFFIIKERPGELRFGLDLADESGDVTPATWNDLRWDHVNKANGHISLDMSTVSPADDKIPATTGLQVNWGSTSTSADLAMVSFQNPVLVAIHAKEMLNVDCS